MILEVKSKIEELITDKKMTKEEKIKIKDLKLDHLGNIVKNLRKRFNSLEDPMNDYPSFRGEMAQIHAEQQWEASVQYYRQLERNLELFECYYRLKSL